MTRATPTVFTVHNSGVGGGALNPLFKIPDKVVAISSEMAEEIVSILKVPGSRVVRIPNGVEPPPAPEDGLQMALRARLGMPRDSFVMVSVGRLAAQKNHGLTLEALGALRNQGRDVFAVIVGDGPDREMLLERRHALGLDDRVRFAGPTTPQPYLRAANAFVLSSDYEGAAIAAVEAMMMSLPVVRTRTAGCADQVVQGITGMSFPPGDATGLQECISVLIDDPEACRRMGVAAREHAEATLSSAGMVASTADVYRGLMSNARATLPVRP